MFDGKIVYFLASEIVGSTETVVLECKIINQKNGSCEINSKNFTIECSEENPITLKQVEYHFNKILVYANSFRGINDWVILDDYYKNNSNKNYFILNFDLDINPYLECLHS